MRRALRAVPVASILFATLLGISESAFAQDDEPFTFIIKGGRNFVTVPDGRGLTVSAAQGNVFPVGDNEVGPDSIATARVTVWNRQVPGAYRNAFSPLAVLVVFEFMQEIGLRAHFSLIETPSGRLATVAAIRKGASGNLLGVERTVVGTWVIDDRNVPGKTAKDLVITGQVRQRLFNVKAAQTLLLKKDSSVTSDATPLATHALQGNPGLAGFFYGKTTLGGLASLVRSYISRLSPAQWAHLLAIRAAGATYAVVACSATGNAAPVTPICTLSGTGGYSSYSGSAHYTAVANGTNLNISPSIVQP
jgi:hypothetical protein